MISNDRPTFKSGAYILSQTMTPQQIFDILSGNTTYKTTFKFTPEKTIAETKANLLNFGYKSQEVDAAFSKIYNSPVLESKPEGAGLDGYLFIREYEFSPAVSVEGIINTCLGESYKIIIENDFASRNSLMHKFLAHDLTIHEALKKASESDKIIENPTLERLVAVAYPDSKIPFIMSGDYKAWLDFYGDLAKKVSNDSKYGGIPYEALLAQSILESSWGKSRLSYKHFNFFGIKYMNMPKNPLVAPSGFVSAETWEEYTPGEITVTTADFATWDSLEKGFLGYAAWIHNQPRYKEALKHSDDPIAYITALKKAGYATDSNYITIVTSIIETIRNLTKTST
jgi:flagellum-specific peptidoglycan hydrolase FlgJ